MTASKLFLTAEARLALRTVPAAAVAPDLLSIASAGFDPLMPGDEVLEIQYDASGVGRASRLTLLMDPVTGAALQRTQHDLDGKLRHRIYRFGRQGAYQRTDQSKKSLCLGHIQNFFQYGENNQIRFLWRT